MVGLIQIQRPCDGGLPKGHGPCGCKGWKGVKGSSQSFVAPKLLRCRSFPKSFKGSRTLGVKSCSKGLKGLSKFPALLIQRNQGFNLGLSCFKRTKDTRASEFAPGLRAPPLLPHASGCPNITQFRADVRRSMCVNINLVKCNHCCSAPRSA